MLGFLGRLFGTKKGMDTALGMADKAVGGVISGIDAAWYTNEEKARDIKEILFKLQDQFTPRSISRRLIAFLFVATFCVAFLVALVFTCLKQTDITTNVINLTIAFKFPYIIITIVIFYFGYYGVEKFKEKK